MQNDISQLLKTENEQLQKLHVLVEKSISDEQLIIQNLKNPINEQLTKGQKLSDKIASFGGSWAFIISFFIVLLFWIIVNSIALKKYQFDPYPFILMNLILSCIAALQAPIIMMSQNRQEEKDRRRSENDYLINVKAELEIKTLHQKIDLLLNEQLKILFETQVQQIALLKKLRKKYLHKIKKESITIPFLSCSGYCWLLLHKP